MGDPRASFAEALRRAIGERGLSLERVQDHLAERGVTISVATLSYWQSGRSVPSRKASLAAIPHLEEVLGIEPGGLRDSLPASRERPRRSVPTLDVLWPEAPASAVLDRLDTRWDAELDRLTVHDVMRVGADRRQQVLSVRQAMRARCDGPDRRVVLHAQDDVTAGLPELRAVRGCRLGRVETDPTGGIVGAELVFSRPLRRGETVIVEYELVSPKPGPAETEYTRRLRLPMREYLLVVEFHPDALPDSVVAVSAGHERPLDLDETHRAHLVHADSTPGLTGIQWSWETAPPGPS